MAETAEQGWQPARFVRVHDRPEGTVVSPDFPDWALVHVLEAKYDIGRRWPGCDAKRMFFIQEAGGYACEHEILTD